MKIAEEAGKYLNFSGIVEYKDVNCVIEHGYFELINNPGEISDIHIEDGILRSGLLSFGFIENAINVGCDIYSCQIKYIINKSGSLKCCKINDCIWYDGTWKDNTDAEGNFLKMPPNSGHLRIADKIGEYKNFSSIINFSDTYCKVANSSFEIFHSGAGVQIEFAELNLLSGTLYTSKILYGKNERGKIIDSFISNFSNNGGELMNCSLEDVDFNGGIAVECFVNSKPFSYP